MTEKPIPVAERNKAWDYGHSPAGTEGSNPAWGMDVCLFLSVERCHVEGSAMDRSLVQRSPTECGVFKAGITRGYCTRFSPASSVAS